MARLIKSVNTPVLNVTIQTCFEDGSVSDKTIKAGSIIEGLRYVLNGELITLSGKVVSIEYSLPSKITFSRSKPEDTFSADITISSITLDCSDQYNSNIVTVPAIEIVEDEGVENVKRMKVFASLSLNMDMYYSNRTMTSVSLQVGDKVDGARIMTAVPGIDITGEFEVVAFSYARNSNNKFTVDGIVLKNEKDGTFIAGLDKILAITEVMTYETSSIEQLAEVLTEARDGETIKLSADVNANDTGIVVDGKDLTLDLAGKTVTAGNTNDNGINVTNGKLTLKGGALVTDQPFDSDHCSVMVAVRTGGELTLEDCTLSAVMDDPVNNGQFGVGIYNDGKAIVNSGTYEAGWYAICTEGSTCTPDASITINGGKFVSPVDYAIYLPQGKLFVNGGEIIGGAGAISCNRGYVEINDGVFKTSGDGDTGTTPNGTGGQSPACIDCSCKYGPVDLVIHGGTFITDNGAPIIHAGTKYTVTVKIDGGEFNVIPPAEYIAEGYQVSETTNEYGYYEVVPVV